MAQRVVLEDDLDGTVEDRSKDIVVETIEFGFNGDLYEIDLTAAHVDEFQDLMEPYVNHARLVQRATKASSRKAASTKSGGPALTNEQKYRNVQIREWAAMQGIPCPPRGVIPRAIREAYEKEVEAA